MIWTPTRSRPAACTIKSTWRTKNLNNAPVSFTYAAACHVGAYILYLHNQHPTHPTGWLKAAGGCLTKALNTSAVNHTEITRKIESMWDFLSKQSKERLETRRKEVTAAVTKRLEDDKEFADLIAGRVPMQSQIHRVSVFHIQTTPARELVCLLEEKTIIKLVDDGDATLYHATKTAAGVTLQKVGRKRKGPVPAEKRPRERAIDFGCDDDEEAVPRANVAESFLAMPGEQ